MAKHDKKLNPERAIAVWYIVTVYQIRNGGLAYTKACEELAAQGLKSREHLIDLYLYGRKLDKPDFHYSVPPRKAIISDHDPAREPFEFWFLGESYVVAPEFLVNEVQAAKVEKGMTDPKYRSKMKRMVDQRVRRWAQKTWPEHWKELL